MNIRKAVDYSTMFATLESVMKADLPQMELYCEIGKAVCAHSEKGAAVAAAEFIKEQYPDMTGFSPRNVRRMRDFWQLYSGMPELLGEAASLELDAECGHHGSEADRRGAPLVHPAGYSTESIQGGASANDRGFCVSGKCSRRKGRCVV